MTRVLIGKFIVLMVFMTTFWFSSKPANISNGQSIGVLVKMKIINKDDTKDETAKFKFWKRRIRKIAHFSLYAIAGLGAFLATGSIKKSIAIVFLMGSIDEMHQYFIPGRGARVSDVLLDTFGGSIGAVFMKILDSLHKLYKEKKKKVRLA